MVAFRLSLLTILSFACGIALIGILPMSVFAQEESNVAEDLTAASSSEAIVEEVGEEVKGYTTEFLPGNEVIGDFVVGPGKTELSLKPGDSAVMQLVVSNRTGEQKKFNFEIEDVTGSHDPNQSVILLGDDRGPYTLKDYIRLPQTSITLEHSQRARVPVTITIPPDAEPGGRYGSVLINTIAVKAVPEELAGTAPQSAIISRIGTLFFVTIEGAAEKEGSLQDFVALPDKKWFSAGPINFGIYFENTGAVHLNPYGELRIKNFMGEEVGFIELEPWFVFPDSLRLREISWNREFLFGKYTAELHVNRGYDDIVDTLEYDFWVLPWKLFAVGFAAIFVFLFLIRMFFRTFEFKRK